LVRSIKATCGEDYPVSIKIRIDDDLRLVPDISLDCIHISYLNWRVLDVIGILPN
jgi:hypothetical protein